MPRATWNGQTLAESDETVVVEGNHYFPPDSVNRDLLEPSEKTSWCPWKGQASYLSARADGQQAPDAAWFYPEPKEKAAEIKDHVAFWGDVSVET